MQAMVEREPMAKKKSESRKHTAVIRVDAHAHARADLAAKLMGKSLADWTSDVILAQAERDIHREARKLAGPSGESKN